jgi:protein-tyrosine phosphatase
VGQYVDLHSHILPGLDDGATDTVSSLEMVHALAKLGFSMVYATPHQRAGMFMPLHDAIAAAMASIAAPVTKALPTMKLDIGAENFWDEVLAERLSTNQVPGYGATRTFLFEVHTSFMPAGLQETLFQIRLAGRLPILAHPERYASIQRSPDSAAELAQKTGLLVDLAAVGGSRGRGEAKVARRLLEEGLAHAAASDMHRPKDEKSIAEGIEWIRKRLGTAALDRLLTDNPRRMLAGELP